MRYGAALILTLILTVGLVPPAAAAETVFSDSERQVIAEFFRERASGDPVGSERSKAERRDRGILPGPGRTGAFPPGLAQHLQRKGTLPPGLEGRLLPTALPRACRCRPMEPRGSLLTTTCC